jgi:hypothetical protein
MSFIAQKRWAGISVPYRVDPEVLFLDPDPVLDHYFLLKAQKNSGKSLIFYKIV